jgi:hypothetical protein
VLQLHPVEERRRAVRSRQFRTTRTI